MAKKNIKKLFGWNKEQEAQWHQALKILDELGCAFAIFTPEEIAQGGVDEFGDLETSVEDLQDLMIQTGWEFIGSEPE